MTYIPPQGPGSNKIIGGLEPETVEAVMRLNFFSPARLTLALLEDLSRLLIVHGYPPLRGRALTENKAVAGDVIGP